MSGVVVDSSHKLKPVAALALLVARLRDAAAEAERQPLARELNRIAEDLLAIRNELISEPTPLHVPERTRLSQRGPQTLRRCSICHTELPLDMFVVTDRRTGKLRSECKPCFNERQRTRYVRAGQKVVTIEVLDGDPCVGHPCSVCGKPFEVGQRVQGDHVHHEGCGEPA